MNYLLSFLFLRTRVIKRADFILGTFTVTNCSSQGTPAVVGATWISLSSFLRMNRAIFAETAQILERAMSTIQLGTLKQLSCIPESLE